MLSTLLKNRRGFTLIEVVIVLAIAGLIFVIVFLAVSQAQAARRDTQRKNDADRLRAAANQYASNHNGNVPTDANWVATYIPTFKDPSGADYTVDYSTSAPGDDHISYRNGNVCNATSDGMTTSGASSRDFAVLIKLERGGTVCVDSK